MPSRSRSLGWDHRAASRRSAATMSSARPMRIALALSPGIVGQCVDQARHRLVEGEVGDHGGDTARMPTLAFRRSRPPPCRRRLVRELEEQVVAGGGALLHLIDGRDQRGRDTCPLRRDDRRSMAWPSAGVRGSQRSPTPFDSPPWLWVWELIRPGMIRRRAASMPFGVGVVHRARRHHVDDRIAFDNDIALFASCSSCR